MTVPVTAMSQPAYPPAIPEAQQETYKTIDDIELCVWIFTPGKHSADDQRPAAVFFFGGGWKAGKPTQFKRHCEYLASRGMVAVTADYRVRNRHGVKAYRCVEDAKSDMRWVRGNAKRLGIDPDRIAAAGGSAGGHLAAATGILPLYDDPNDNLSISARPDAMILFNPAVVLGPISGKMELPADFITSLKERMGVELESISPYHHIKPGLPPTIIFHGTADRKVEYKAVELYREKAKAHGNHCVLVGYHDAGHGFFNYGRGDNAHFVDTINKMDAFLVSLGYLKGAPHTVYN